MADPGFPKRGLQGGGANLLFGKCSPQNCMTMKEIGLKGCFPSPPPPHPPVCGENFNRQSNRYYYCVVTCKMHLNCLEILVEFPFCKLYLTDLSKSQIRNMKREKIIRTYQQICAFKTDEFILCFRKFSKG